MEQQQGRPGRPRCPHALQQRRLCLQRKAALHGAPHFRGMPVAKHHFGYTNNINATLTPRAAAGNFDKHIAGCGRAEPRARMLPTRACESCSKALGAGAQQLCPPYILGLLAPSKSDALLVGAL